MNTPAHVIFALAAFARPGDRRRTVAAVAGALAPDASLYLMSGVSLYVLGISASYVFDVLYFSDAWQQVFAIDNSFVLWGVLLGFCLWRGWENGRVFALSALLHLVFDFALHHDDARRHFWPVTDWVFVSPVSYWDRAHYGAYVGPLEIAACVVLGALLIRRFWSLRSRAVIGALLAMQVAPVFIWVFVFASG